MITINDFEKKETGGRGNDFYLGLVSLAGFVRFFLGYLRFCNKPNIRMIQLQVFGAVLRKKSRIFCSSYTSGLAL
jgi:hypothetical protein